MSQNVLIALRTTACLPCVALLLAACSHDSDPAREAHNNSYVAVAKGRIAVEGGLLLLTSPRDGTVTAVAAHEGARVRRGELLAQLDDREARLAVRGAEAELKQELTKHQLLSRELATSQQRAERFVAAARAGAGEMQAADDAQAAATELAGQLQMAQSAVEMSRYKLDAMRQELEFRALRAPLDALVVRVSVQPGARASPQSPPLITLLPDGSTIVRADLNETYVDAVRVGMPATVSTEDDRGATWPAHLLRISALEGTLPIDEAPPSQMTVGTVECVLTLDAPTPLRIGERVLVRFGMVGKG